MYLVYAALDKQIRNGVVKPSLELPGGLTSNANDDLSKGRL